MERLQQRLDALPIDAVKRCSYLLRPLINSAAFVLFELIQGSPRSDNLTPLSRIEGQPSASSNDAPSEEDPDSAELPDTWPPPLSHLPLSSSAEDASDLGVTGWPRTAPPNRDSLDVEARCRAQQARAHRFHPLLFAAPSRDLFAAHFSAILYNNEFHNYDEVIRVVRRFLGCTAQQATLFAILVNRDGRTPIVTSAVRRSVSKLCADISSAESRTSPRPLRTNAMDSNIYAVEQFFICVLRWLERLASAVRPLRPLICNALLGRHITFASGATSGTSASAATVLPPGEMLVERSLIALLLERFHATHRGVRKVAAHLIVAVLLQESFHRRIFAIEFTRHFDSVCQAYVYDDHLDADSLFSLTCQFYTVTSLARQLLQQNNAALRVISRLCRAIAANSVPLHAFYEIPQSRNWVADLFNPSCTFHHFPSALQTRLQTLRAANRVAWRRAYEYTRVADEADSGSVVEQSRYPPSVFVWLHVMEPRPEFSPFQRMLRVTGEVRYLLVSLLNMKPLAGESEECPEGWWDVCSRENFMAYFRRFLELMSYLQDMNAMQRAVDVHVETEQEWISSFNMISYLFTVISLTVQVASTDRSLLLSAIKEARDAFEDRVGVIDRCFRVKPLTRTQKDRASERDDNGIENLTFQTLGATSEIYEYDVSTMKVSIVQTLPRLLAALYGHGIEMGLSPTRLGLADEGFANLIIERPLQTIAFCAQCSANLWVRNGLVIQNIMQNMFNNLRVEMVDRNYQLIQQAATVLSPDELIVRMVHKLNLKDYLSETPSQPKPGRVQAMESLLRVIHFIVTSRSRYDVGHFDPSVVAALPSSPHLFPANFNDLDESLEINYGLLVDDVIHQLCIRPMTHSELLSALPFQPAGCLLRKAPPYTGSKEGAAGSDSKDVIEREAATCSWRGSRKDSVERPLARILQQLATQTMVGSKQKFALRPEVIANRFDRFYTTYRHTDQTHAEELVTRTLKKTLESSSNILPADFPIPPPPPRPRRRFSKHLNGPILGLLRCTTFVRLLRQLLDIGIKQGNLQSKWSETLFELVLHLIIIALYEDSIAFAETGERPFLKAVSQVPEEAESDEELERLAVFQHWKRHDPSADSCVKNYNCVLPRLKLLVGLPDHERQADLIRWVMKLWKEVAEGQSAMSPLQTPSMDVDEESPALEKQRRLEAKRQRQANILAKMSNMQRKFIATHAQFEGLADEEEEDAEDAADQTSRVPKPAKPIQDLAPDANDFSSIAALGPNPHRDRMKDVEKEPASVTCILCLEEMPENAEHGLVVAAFASRSNVLSTSLPCGRAVTFSDSGGSISSRAVTINSATVKPSWIDRNLAAIATTAVAASVGSGETVLSQLPRLLADLPSCAVGEGEVNLSEPPPVASSSSSVPVDCTNGQKTEEVGNPAAAEAGDLDPCFPRPLVASRDPIGEEGTFIAFCPHAMHAACKEKYARQLKNRSDQIGRRLGNRAPIYEFRCSVCKALSNFDLPLYGRVTDGLSRVWLSRQLTVGQNNYDFAAWLRRIQRWLDGRPPSAAPGSATDRQRKDFPASLEQLYRLIHSNWSSEGDVLLAANLEPISSARLAQLRAFLTETYWHCKLSFPEPETSDSVVTESAEESSAMSESVQVRRSRSILGHARSLLRRCFRRVATTGGASAEASGEAPMSSSAMVSPSHVSAEHSHVLLEPPVQPPRVSTSLRVFVQRLAMLSQPCRLETLQRLSRRSAAQVFFNFPIQTPHNPEELLELIMETFNPIEETLLDGPLPATAQATIHPGAAATSTHRVPTARETPVGSSSGISGRSPGIIPPPLCEAVDELHLSLRSSYARLLVFAEFISPSEDEAEIEATEPASLVSSTQIDRFYQAATHLRAAVECTRRRGLRAVWSAACEWRAVRHSVAYTLVVWERHMRQLSPTSNFFNEELADRYKMGLGYLLRATFKAHAQLAPVSRGCPLTCQKADDETDQRSHTDCWPQRRDDPVWWWWWSYFSPTSPDAADTIASCCHEDTLQASNLVEAVTRVAVSEDAARLWRLLLPDCRTLTASAHSDPAQIESAMVMGDGSPHRGSSTSASSAQSGTDLWSEKSPASLNQPISILWEADITFLFVNLLFLRPGVEEENAAVECQRLQSLRAIKNAEAERESAATETESVRQPELPLLAACDEGFPRLPIGDSHEAFLLRLCYTALLVQALLSWQPDTVPGDLQQQSNQSETDPSIAAWLTSKLLVVRRRLQQLCGLPVHTSVPSSPTALGGQRGRGEEETATLRSLFEHIRVHCLPFLRIAAFIIQQITNIDLPANLSQQEQESLGKPVDEFILLLAYLGLPLGPTDLLVMLSDEFTPSLVTKRVPLSESEAVGLSSSLWLARLITSWCLVGRSSVSRRLYAKLRKQFLPQPAAAASSVAVPSTLPCLLPQPQIRVPHLISLPREYVSLLAMTTELKSVHTGSNIHSDPSLCLACGAVACFACYSCRTFEHCDQPLRDRVGDGGGSSTYRREYPVYDMQAHVRRNHSGYALILLLQSGHLLLLSDQARRTTELTEPYRDEFGETDVDLRRGNPLFLDEPAYRSLNEVWLKHQTAHATSSDLYLV
uniref:E3 ubiquitin-protein ligase n=1 Tax=Schistocephalus solidus TaxID=70667 RepID=A0A0X3P8H3_SCHSO